MKRTLYLILLFIFVGCGTTKEQHRSHGGPLLIELHNEPREYAYRLHIVTDTGLFVSTAELDRYDFGSESATEFIRYSSIKVLSIPRAGSSVRGVLYGLLIGVGASLLPQLAIEAGGNRGILTGLTFILFLPIFMPIGGIIGSHLNEYDVYHPTENTIPYVIREKLESVMYQKHQEIE